MKVCRFRGTITYGDFAQAGMMPVIADSVLPASGELPKGEGAYDGKHEK